MRPIEIKKNIYWIGVADWNIRDFHGYSTYQGSTYNAYLIVDEKTTLIDTVKKEFANELIDMISQIVDPKSIDYVISNHTEMDHSGGLPRLMHKIGEDKPLYCSKMGFKNLTRHFRQPWNYQPVEDGGELNLGEYPFVLSKKILDDGMARILGQPGDIRCQRPIPDDQNCAHVRLSFSNKSGR